MLIILTLIVTRTSFDIRKYYIYTFFLFRLDPDMRESKCFRHGKAGNSICHWDQTKNVQYYSYYIQPS